MAANGTHGLGPRRIFGAPPRRTRQQERATTEGTSRNLPQKWGLWLAIEGEVRFLAHRDCARLVERAAVRARVPLKYTQGFNPHPVLSLPSPRPVGVAGLDELVVVELTEPIKADDLIERMNRQVPPGMRFHRAGRLEDKKPPQPRRIRYEWTIPAGRAPTLRQRLEEFQRAESWFFERRLPAKRRGKPPRQRRIDLKQLVETVAIDGPTLRWTLAPADDLWARPAEVLEALGLDGQVDLAGLVRTAVHYDPTTAERGRS